MKNYSAKILYNTGFGVLSVMSNNYSGHTTNITYQHIDGGKCAIKDEFVMLNSQASPAPSWTSANDTPNIIKMMVKTSAIVLGVIAVAVLSVKCYLRQKNKREQRRERNYQQDHVEMVEEQV
jgi:hypothetical protein